MRDVMCSGYVAGGNTQFFGAGKSITGPLKPTEVEDAMTKRLAFQDDATGEYQSMLAFPAPYGDGAKRDQVISITDRLLPWEVTKNNGTKEYFPGHETTFLAYRNAFRLDTIHFGEDVRAAENMEFVAQGASPPRPRTRARGAEPAAQALAPRRLDEQRPLLRGPAPQVQPVRRVHPRAGARPGALRAG